MSGQQQEDKNHMQVLWMIFGIFIVGGTIWFMFGDALKQFFLWVRWAEIQFVHLFVQFLPVDWVVPEFARAVIQIQYLNPANLSLEAATDISIGVGTYLRIPLGIILVILSWVVYTKHVQQKYKKTYNMDLLRNQEKENWPQVEPVDKLDLLEQDLDEGPWAMAWTPMQFAKRHKLLDIELVPPPPGTLEKKNHFKATVNKERANARFSKQLGKPWQGPDRLPEHVKALFAVFIGRGCRDSKAAMSLVAQFAYSMGRTGELDTTGVDEMIAKHINNEDVQDLLRQHAYISTVMTSMLGFARQDGVLATADFIWLKPIDRTIWYTLNSVGRQTPAVESGGIYAHWLAERALRRPLTVPMVDEATKALQIAVDELIYKPSREEEQEIIEKFQAGQ